VGSPDCHGLDDDRAISMTRQGQMSQHGCGKVKGRKAPPKGAWDAVSLFTSQPSRLRGG
jgi:hypothetical protein